MKKILAGLLLALSSIGAQASTVTFQDLSFGSCAWYGSSGVTSGGYSFTGNTADAHLFGCSAGLIAGNTSNALINANAHSIITMSQVGGGVFSLTSFEAGNRYDAPYYYGTSTGLDVVGYLNGGGTVSQQFAFNGNAFDLFTLGSGFSNLDYVVFTAIGNGGSNGASGPEFVIDNIVVNETVAVPEPASLALLALGLFGFAAARRRKM